EGLAAPHVIETQNPQDEILRRHVRVALATDYDLHRFRHLDANILGNPAIEYIRGANSKSNAADRAHVRSVRIRTNVELSGQRVALEHYRVTDALRPFAILQFAMQLDSLLGGEILLLQFQLGRQIKQAKLFLLL